MSAVLYIDRHGTKVGVAQGQLTLKAQDKEEQSLPRHQIDQIIVLAHAHFSHDAIALLLREDIPVIFSSLRGGFRGTLSSRPGHQILRRKRQMKSPATSALRAVGGGFSVLRPERGGVATATAYRSLPER